MLNDDDVTRCIGTIFQKENRTKYFDFPSAVYSTLPYDAVRKDGKTVGVSTWCGYSANEGAMLTLAMVDVEHSEPGTEVMFVWGKRAAGLPSPRSSATCRSRFARRLRRFRTPARRGMRTGPIGDSVVKNGKPVLPAVRRGLA